MGINKEDTERLLHLILLNYRQYKPGIRPSYKNIKTN